MLEVVALRFIAPNSHTIRFGDHKPEKNHDFLELSRFTDEAFICNQLFVCENFRACGASVCFRHYNFVLTAIVDAHRKNLTYI